MVCNFWALLRRIINNREFINEFITVFSREGAETPNGRIGSRLTKKDIEKFTISVPEKRRDKLLSDILSIKYLSIPDSGTTRKRTDENWKLTTNGPTRKNNEFDGEFYDSRMELDG